MLLKWLKLRKFIF